MHTLRCRLWRTRTGWLGHKVVEKLDTLAYPAAVEALDTATTDDPDAEVGRAAVAA
jgi:hypothetical protein